MSGLSPRNLLAMKVFARKFPDGPIAQQAVAQLPWGHVLQIMQRVKDPAARDYYIHEAITHGWSRNILETKIQRQLHLAVAAWQTQLTETLPQELKGSLPTIEEIEAELAGDLGTEEGEQND